MQSNSKELFEALNLLRYSSEHVAEDITKEEIVDAYYKIFELICQVKLAEDSYKAQKEKEAEQKKITSEIKEKFNNMGAQEIALDISDKIVALGLNKNYVVSEMSDCKIAIIEGTSSNNKKIIREYDDFYDYYANILEDLKCDFKREKLFSNMKTLKKGDREC